jgi:hypothetical protein
MIACNPSQGGFMSVFQKNRTIKNLAVLASFAVFPLVAESAIEKPQLKTVEKTHAVYISYSKPEKIYKKAQKKCNKFFSRAIASKPRERSSYSVEIINVVPKIKKASALCVARAYDNQSVKALKRKY